MPGPNSQRSFVSLGYERCPSCGATHSEVVLLDQRLKESLEPRTCVGVSACAKCAEAHKGYVLLLESDAGDLSDFTGVSAWIAESFWPELFHAPLPKKRNGVHTALCSRACMEQLRAATRRPDP